ncbi:hypothetical protein [Pedobacter helvus]|uniref:Uncharacterized protein n=1 Tax=Pedobacter helvus TaxID=2563444 RepID=A0ABW9JJ08_9SPHI
MKVIYELAAKAEGNKPTAQMPGLRPPNCKSRSAKGSTKRDRIGFLRYVTKVRRTEMIIANRN